jgi:glycerol-3-phosphate dehydrogenase
VLALADGHPELLEPAVAGLPYTRAELVYAAREEMAQTLDDVLARRTRAMIQRAQATMDAAPAAAELIAPDLGWSAAEAAEQAALFTESCEKELLTAGLDLP